MEPTTFPAQGQRRKRKTGMVVIAAIGGALLTAAVVIDGPGSSGEQDSATQAPATATTTPPAPTADMVARAADRAALVQLCVDGLADPEAAAEYQRARAAHPGLAEGIGPDCQLEPQPQRVPAGRLGIALR